MRRVARRGERNCWGGAPCWGEPRCDLWLIGRRDEQPDHLCYEVALGSVEWFAAQRRVITSRLDDLLCATWPLPAGITAIAQQKRGFSAQLRDADPDYLPQPYVYGDDTAMVGLALRRKTADADLWFLGFVRRRAWRDEELPALLRFWRQRVRGAEGCGSAPDALTWLKHEAPYQFAGSTFLVEGMVDEALGREAHRIRRWYDARLLGKSAIGRPPGTGLFADKDSLLRAVAHADVALRRQGIRVTQEQIVEFLSNIGYACDVRTFQRCTRRAGFRAFRDLLRAAAEHTEV